MTTTPNQKLTFRVRTVILIIIAIASFLFSVGIVYSTITENSADIAEMKPQVRKIPVLESRLETLVTGQKEMQIDIKTLLQRK